MLCLRKFPVAKNFMDKRGGGSIKIFRRKFFCLTVPKKFAGEFFSISLLSLGQENGDGNHDFPSKLLCLAVPKHFVGEPFCAVFEKISGSKKLYG